MNILSYKCIKKIHHFPGDAFLFLLSQKIKLSPIHKTSKTDAIFYIQKELLKLSLNLPNFIFYQKQTIIFQYYKQNLFTNSTTTYMRFMVVLALLCFVSSINQQCQYNSSNANKVSQTILFQQYQNCPPNAHCLANGFCACNDGYIGDCSQFALTLQDSIQLQATITNGNFSFFKCEVEQSEQFMIMFLIGNKQGSSINSLIFNIWDDNGDLKNLAQNNKLENIETISGYNFMLITTQYIKFTKQPNGMTEAVIIGLKLKDSQSMKLTIFIVKSGPFNYWRLIIIVIASIIISIFVFVYLKQKFKRRRDIQTVRQFTNNYLVDIDKNMPKYKFHNLENQVILDDSCSICLQIFQQDQWLRKTVCRHIFHQECLDKWCSTNPVCPLCKKSLQNIHLNQQQMQITVQNGNNIHQNLLF